MPSRIYTQRMRGISASQNTGLEEEGMTGKKVRKPTGDQMQGGGGGLVGCASPFMSVDDRI